MSKIKVAIAQHACSSSYDHNLQAGLNGIQQAAAAGADLVLLPELSMGTYFCIKEDPACFDLAETIPGPTSKALQAAAKENNIVVVATVFEKRAKGLYHNTAIVLDKDGSLAGSYRKMHIPDDPGYYEKYYFTPGDTGFKPINTSIGKLGVLVCWDQWYPEGARIMALSGAELLLFPSAIGWEPDADKAEQERQRDAWITIQRAHAVANNLPVLSSNRVGMEKDPDSDMASLFWGSSFITGQQGEILATAATDKEEVIVSEIDLDKTEQVRRVWPYFRDRRIDAYAGILKRHIDDE
ncbi:MAG: carbon-nitrogen hydrolase [Gammaproteobacteria bacterium]